MRTEVRTLIAADFDTRSAADVSALLRHADMRVRQKAQFELVRRGDVAVARSLRRRIRRTAWPASMASGASRSWRGRQGRGAARGAPDAVPYRCRRRDPRAGGEDDRRPALRAGGRERSCRCSPTPRRAPGSSRPRRSAGSPTSRRRRTIVAMLAANDDKDVYLRHAGSLALLAHRRRAGARRALARTRRAACASPPSSRCAGLRSPEVARFVTDADDAIVLEAARAINDDGGDRRRRCRRWRGCSTTKRSPREPLLRRAISANLKVGIGRGARAARGVRRRLRPAAVDARRGGCGPGRLGEIRRRWIASTASISASRKAARRLPPLRPPCFA